ncbi:MAG: nucleotidyltransferase domain-containing protein [Armatimonadetes bacterium]|nr:nucleotidyltransferase domain-containing protein [Armatimonadota bacterium]
MISDRDLSEAAERLVSAFRPVRIILFGSQARGDAHERSDVALLVVCPLRDDRRRLMVAMDRTLKGLDFARDIIVLSPEEYERDRLIPGTIARPASREGVVLYEASAGSD